MGAGYSQYEEEDEQSEGGYAERCRSIVPPAHKQEYVTKLARKNGTAATIGSLLVYDGFRGRILPDYTLFSEELTVPLIMELNMYEISITEENEDETYDGYNDVQKKMGWSEIGWRNTKKEERTSQQKAIAHIAMRTFRRNIDSTRATALVRSYYLFFFHILIVLSNIERPSLSGIFESFLDKIDNWLSRENHSLLRSEMIRLFAEGEPAESVITTLPRVLTELHGEFLGIMLEDYVTHHPNGTPWNRERWWTKWRKESAAVSNVRALSSELRMEAAVAYTYLGKKVTNPTDERVPPHEGFELVWENFRVSSDTILNRYLYDDRMIFLAKSNFALQTQEEPFSASDTRTTLFLTWETTRSISKLTLLHLDGLGLTLDWIGENLDDFRKYLAQITAFGAATAAMDVEGAPVVTTDLNPMWREGTEELALLRSWRLMGSRRLSRLIVEFYRGGRLDTAREIADTRAFLKLFHAAKPLPPGARMFVGANETLIGELGGRNPNLGDAFDIHAPIAATVSPDVAIKFAINGQTHRVLILEMAEDTKVKALDVNPLALYATLAAGYHWVKDAVDIVMEFELVLQPELRYTLVEDNYYWLDSADTKRFSGRARSYSQARKIRVQRWSIARLIPSGALPLPTGYEGSGEHAHKRQKKIGAPLPIGDRASDDALDEALYDAFTQEGDREREGQYLRPDDYGSSEVTWSRGAWELPAKFNHNGARVHIGTLRAIHVGVTDKSKPRVLFIHGVPANKDSYIEIMRLVAPFVDAWAIDLLGMGESSMPLDYGWSWRRDADYIAAFIKDKGSSSMHIVADDWGAGPAQHLAANYRLLVRSLTLIDPIAGDGYPVAEIQAIGRASQLEYNPAPDIMDAFKAAMGAFDQTLVQILKTMIYAGNQRSQRLDQYFWRTMKRPYFEVDYARAAQIPLGVRGKEARAKAAVLLGANSRTLRPKWNAIRVLAQRAAILAPNSLLPYHAERNPAGVHFSRITAPVAIFWGEFDNMMPQAQQHRMAHEFMHAARVETILVPRAGHFAGLDQPDFFATYWLEFVMDVRGRGAFGEIFLGMREVGKGDERAVRGALRAIYDKKNRQTDPEPGELEYDEETGALIY